MLIEINRYVKSTGEIKKILINTIYVIKLEPSSFLVETGEGPDDPEYGQEEKVICRVRMDTPDDNMIYINAKYATMAKKMRNK